MCHKNIYRLPSEIRSRDLLDLRLSIFQVEVLLARQSAKRGASYIGYYGGILGAHSRINMSKINI